MFRPARATARQFSVDHRRRQFRRGADVEQSRRAAPSGFAHQDHDALSAVRASRVRQDEARHRDAGVPARRRSGSDQAQPASRPDHPRRGRDQGSRHPLRQRRRRRDRRSDRRQRRRFRQDDDAQGARARHEPHRSTATPTACPTTSRSRPRATRRRSAAPSRSASRATIAISRPRVQLSRPVRSATTITCSAASRAWTASRPATPAPPASIS